MISDFNTPIIIAEAYFKAVKLYPACLLSVYGGSYSGAKVITIEDRENRKEELLYIFTTKGFMINISAGKLLC